MELSTEEDSPSEDNEEDIKQEVERNFFLYILLFIISYYASYILPIILFMAFYLLFFGPYFLENHDFISLFTDLRSLIALLTLPLVILGCYLFRLFFMGLITRIFWSPLISLNIDKEGEMFVVRWRLISRTREKTIWPPFGDRVSKSHHGEEEKSRRAAYKKEAQMRKESDQIW